MPTPVMGETEDEYKLLPNFSLWSELGTSWTEPPKEEE